MSVALVGIAAPAAIVTVMSVVPVLAGIVIAAPVATEIAMNAVLAATERAVIAALVVIA
jgi:hypothetical protein